jgi:sulfur carrier protein ThiS
MKSALITTALVSLLAAALGCSTKHFGLSPGNDILVQGEMLNSKVDVIFMVDTSSSMLRHQQKLKAQIPALIASLNAQGMNWRLAVTTADLNGSGGEFDGGVNDKFIDGTRPESEGAVENRVIQGESGSDLERGLLTTLSSLQTASAMLRPDAMLNIIFLSDDNDYSTTTSAQFVAAVDALKPPFKSGLRSWVANYIGTVQLTQECTQSLGQWNGIGQKYVDVVTATGGVAESICSSDLSQAVNHVKVRMADLLTEFKLSKLPKIQTIVVKINGQVVPAATVNGWEYIPSNNSVKFHGTAIPKPNDVVDITFDPAQAT